MTILTKLASQTYSECEIPGNWVIGGNCRLLDSYSPDHLIMRSPTFRYGPQAVKFSLEHKEISPSIRHWKTKLKYAVKKNTSQKKEFGASDIVFDTRFDTNANIAHVIQHQIGPALLALKELGLEDRSSDLTFIVHDNIPQYALNLFHVLGFKTYMSTFDKVQGNILEVDPIPANRLTIVSEVLRNHANSLGIISDVTKNAGKLFLARKGRRSLNNLAAAEKILNQNEYETIYPEELKLEDQISTIASAKAIFALHGAAIAFGMFRSPDYQGLLIEAFPSCFSTNWARVIAHEAGDIWLGCQGDITADDVDNIIGQSHAHKREAENYHIEPRAISAVVALGEKYLNNEDIDPQNPFYLFIDVN